MYEITVRVAPIAAAHAIKDHWSECKNIHGHNWEVFVTVAGSNLDKEGILVDFGWLKRIIRDKVFNELDHSIINDKIHVDNASTEVVAEWIYNQLVQIITPDLSVRITKVRVVETENNEACYIPEPLSLR